MKKYSAPNVVEYGKSSKLIKGSCGWGTENIYFDKTGYATYSWKKWENLPELDYPVCRVVTGCENYQPPDECS